MGQPHQDNKKPGMKRNAERTQEGREENSTDQSDKKSHQAITLGTNALPQSPIVLKELMHAHAPQLQVQAQNQQAQAQVENLQLSQVKTTAATTSNAICPANQNYSIYKDAYMASTEYAAKDCFGIAPTPPKAPVVLPVSAPAISIGSTHASPSAVVQTTSPTASSQLEPSTPSAFSPNATSSGIFTPIHSKNGSKRSSYESNGLSRNQMPPGSESKQLLSIIDYRAMNVVPCPPLDFWNYDDEVMAPPLKVFKPAKLVYEDLSDDE